MGLSVVIGRSVLLLPDRSGRSAAVDLADLSRGRPSGEPGVLRLWSIEWSESCAIRIMISDMTMSDVSSLRIVRALPCEPPPHMLTPFNSQP